MPHTLKMADGVSYAANLRRELCFRNAEFARLQGLNHVQSYGREPAIIYAPVESQPHGNFFPRQLQGHPEERQLALAPGQSPHPGQDSLPKADRRWRELDSCVSSDALLMNIFCCPRVLRSRNVAAMLGVEPTSRPQFGYRPRVPLLTGHIDRTEVDLKLGDLLIEAKLTESDFQTQSARLVETYRDSKRFLTLRGFRGLHQFSPLIHFRTMNATQRRPLILISIITRLFLRRRRLTGPQQTEKKPPPDTSPTSSSATFLLLTPPDTASAS